MASHRLCSQRILTISISSATKIANVGSHHVHDAAADEQHFGLLYPGMTTSWQGSCG